MASIRLFLTMTLIAIIVLVTFLSALRGYRQSMQQAETLFDLQLLEHVKLLTLLTPGVDAGSVVLDELLLPEQANLEMEDQLLIAYQIFSEAGRLILRSSNAPTQQIAELEVGYSDINFNGYRWRALVVEDLVNKHWVMAAQRIDARFELAESIILQAVIPTVWSIPVAGVLIWLIVGFGLRPINQLAAEVRRREVSDLSAVEMDGVPAELSPLTRSTNDLLRRLQSSFAREKRFAADAAHELRTPISVLKVQVHNVLAGLEKPDATVEELKHGVDAMGHLVEQILLLNKMTPDQYIGQFEQVDIYQLAVDAAGIEHPQMLKKGQVFELQGNSTLMRGDPTALRSMIQNLLSNASKYAPEEGKIILSVNKDKQLVTLQVEDSGPGVPESFHERVFDRFYRLDGDRHDSTISGSGLGLAIVRHIIEMHSARIKLSKSELLGGLCVTVCFPGQENSVERGIS
ncbi:MAG: ATP-binding protein [Pseudomonadales bacterium]|nr:ATP-binding protein [Pseudomonadales bacterium]